MVDPDGKDDKKDNDQYGSERLIVVHIIPTTMSWIDLAILDLTEWLCRKFQLLTGRTNVWLAMQLTNLSIIVYFVWVGVYFWSSDVGHASPSGYSARASYTS